MALKIILTTNARRDIQQAIDWENERLTGLGERFLHHLEQKLSALSIKPFIGSVRYDSVRCTTTSVFQYVIHYTVNADAQLVTVLRVLHTRQRPLW